MIYYKKCKYMKKTAVILAMTVTFGTFAAYERSAAAANGLITPEDIPNVSEHTVIDYDNTATDVKNGLIASFDFDAEDGTETLYDSVNNIKANVVAGLPGWCITSNENVQEWDYSNVKLDYVNPDTYMGAQSKNDGMPRFTRRKKGDIGAYIGFYNIGAGVEIEDNDKIPAANNEEYSISFWVKGEGNSLRQNQVVYEERGKGKSYIKFLTSVRDLPQYYYYEGAFLRVIIADENGDVILDKVTEGYPFDCSWHMVTWTDSKGSGAVYIDGEKDSTDFSYDYSKKPQYVKSYIGTPADEVDGIENRCANYYYGAVDDLNLYNRVISQAEMKELFYNIKSDRVAWVEFEDDLGDYEKNLTLSGEPVYTDGILGKGIRLGTELNAKKHPAVSFDDTFTAAFWIKCDGSGTNIVISRGSDDFIVTAGEKISFGITQANNEKVQVSADLPQMNKWFHVGAVADGEKLILYIDAKAAAEAEYDGTVKNTGNIKIGSGDDIGVIDDLRLNTYGCSQTELAIFQDMQPEYVKKAAARLYDMIDTANPEMNPITAAYGAGEYQKMLDMFRDYYFDLTTNKILPELECSVANGTWIYYGYDDEKVAYGRGQSFASFDDIGEFGALNWEYGAFGEIKQYHHMTVDYWQWAINQMEDLDFKMYVSFGQEEYYERYFKFARDMAMNRYDMLISNKAEWSAVGFQQPLHPNIAQVTCKDLSTYLLYFIKANPELAKRYLSPTVLVECIEEVETRYLQSLMNVTIFGNHEIESKSMAAEYALRFKGLKISDEIYKDFMNYSNAIQNGEFMKDGTGFEATWHYAVALPYRFGQTYELFKSLGHDDYAMVNLANQVKYRARMIACHIMPYGDSFIGLGSSGGAALWEKTEYGGADAEDRLVREGVGKMLVNEVVSSDPLIKQIVNVTKDSGDVPKFTSMTFPYVGNSLLRSGWSDDDNLLFLVGSTSRQKDNEDKLSVQLAAHGRLLLGRAGHSQGNEGLGIRGKYAFVSYGNNTVNVDDAIHVAPMYYNNYRTEPMNYRFLTSDNFDFAEGVLSTGYIKYTDFLAARQELNTPYVDNVEKVAKDVGHHRQVISVRDKDVYIILDRMSADSAHEYHQEWHVPSSFPEESVIVSDDGFVTKDDRGANVALYQFYNDEISADKYYGWINEDETMARGWEMRTYSGDWDKATDVSYTFKSDGDTVLATVITPLKDTNEIVKFKKNIGSGNKQGFEIGLTDGTVIKLLTSPEHAELGLDGVSAKAKTLLTVSEEGKPDKGIVLDAVSCDIGGKKVNCTYQNSYEYEVNDTLSLTPIKVPQTFKWVEQDGNLMPVYQNVDLSKIK